MTEIGSLKQSFKKCVRKSQREGFYLDCNYFDEKEERFLVDTKASDFSSNTDKGVKFRIWTGHQFIEGATSSLNEETHNQIVQNLINRAKKETQQKRELAVDKKTEERDFLGRKEDKQGGECYQILKDIRDEIEELDKDIKFVRTGLIEKFEKHLFVNPHKCLYQEIPLYVLVMSAFIESDSGIKHAYDSIVNDSYKVIRLAKNHIKEFEKEIQQKKHSKHLKGGKYVVILSPKLSGLLAHESFGHGLEADMMLKNRTLSSKWLGRRIGSEDVSIIDSPNIEGKHGFFYFDNEGNFGKETYLVKKGIIEKPIADIYSKTYLNLPSSQNGRFESFDHKHYTRMSNTYFQAGGKSFEELISQVEDGIFIKDAGGGMEDPKSWGVQIQGCFGQRIKQGKLIEEFYDGFSFTGFLPTIIGNIKGVSKDFEIEGGGMCGKGHKEWVRVSEGGPHLLIEEVILG